MSAAITIADALRTRFIYFLYQLFLGLAAPVVPFYAALRILRNRSYGSTIAERLGFLPSHLHRTTPGALWIHAVSVGEVISAAAIIRKWREQPSGRVFLSTTTLAGYQAAEERLRDLIDGHFHAPLDYAWAVRRVLRRIQPSALIVLETEIWPNLFRETWRAGAALIVANGRISSRAFPRYRRLNWLFRAVLEQPNRILVQNEIMRSRYLTLGAPADRIEVAGNVKFDFIPASPTPDSPVLEWLARGKGSLWIAASTTEDESVNEDAAVLDAMSKLQGWRLILAPRKPERFDRVARLLERREFRFWRRTSNRFAGDEPVLLLDTIGELGSLFGNAEVVFIGGTFTSTEGHNFLEPAFAARPIISGPRLENFRDLADLFIERSAILLVPNPEDLARAAEEAAGNREMGKRARELAEGNRGASARVIEAVRAAYQASLFIRPKLLLFRITLGPLALIWNLGARVRLARENGMKTRLHTPVISVGNITAGGTGKTPVVLFLARWLSARGLKPAVLSRGHGRISHEKTLLLAPGETADVWHTGDEAQIFLRSGVTAVGIGHDRAKTGAAMESGLHPDVLLLDDGFSHRRLQRDVDLVLIDALAPFGGCAAIPLGRLREPMKSLARANLFLLTRWEPWLPVGGIEKEIRKFNHRAPIFRSRQIAIEWVSFETGKPVLPKDPAIAFCGLGNHQSFWRSVAQQGIVPLDRLEFDDHHRYTPRDLEHIVRHAHAVGAKSLLTTEKDVVNLCEGCQDILAGLDLLWLRIDVVIENETGFLEFLRGVLKPVRLQSSGR